MKEEKSSTTIHGEYVLWRGTPMRTDAWRKILGSSKYLCRHIRYGIKDMPSVPFVKGEVLPPIPQTEADKIFAQSDLNNGLRENIYEELSYEYAMRQVEDGKIISSSFVAWQGHGDEKKGRFIINLHKQSKHWDKGSIKMKKIPSFALELEKGDQMLSFDIKSGYRHMYLHPDMRD